MPTQSKKSRLLKQAQEKLASFGTSQLEDFLKEDLSELFTMPIKLLHISTKGALNPHAFYSETNDIVPMCITESFTKKVLIHASRGIMPAVFETNYYYGDLKKEGVDLRIFNPSKVKIQPMDSVLKKIAHLLTEHMADKNSDVLALGQKNKIVTNIFYAHGKNKEVVVIGLRWIESKKSWRLFGWELGERDKQSDVCRLFFQK